jgi:2-polyprenyl-3-methyl-5-hydroxy-6-metoxy-1,4-benzoquinol methylase
MSLYASLAQSYDELFPLPPLAAPFLDALVPSDAERGATPRSLLDAGCATGDQAIALARLGWRAFGIDSEAAMIEAAQAKARAEAADAVFSVASMLDLDKLFPACSLDLVLCLGNTLPHLRGDGIGAFLEASRKLLRPTGALVLQLLNYGLAGIGAGYAFPPLVSGQTEMRRRYESLGSGKKSEGPRQPRNGEAEALRFIVELKSGGGWKTEETILEPIAPPRLESLLTRAGFRVSARSSLWGGAVFEESLDRFLILVARPA